MGTRHLLHHWDLRLRPYIMSKINLKLFSTHIFCIKTYILQFLITINCFQAYLKQSPTYFL